MAPIWPAEAVVAADGRISYDGVAYDTPSAAALVVKQGSRVNGWRFWAIDDTERRTLAALRAEVTSPAPGAS